MDPAARSLHPPGLTSLPAALFLSTPWKRMNLRRTGGRKIPSFGRFRTRGAALLVPACRDGGGLFQVSDDDNARSAGFGNGGNRRGELAKPPAAMRQFRSFGCSLVIGPDRPVAALRDRSHERADCARSCRSLSMVGTSLVRPSASLHDRPGTGGKRKKAGVDTMGRSARSGGSLDALRRFRSYSRLQPRRPDDAHRAITAFLNLMPRTGWGSTARAPNSG